MTIAGADADADPVADAHADTPPSEDGQRQAANSSASVHQDKSEELEHDAGNAPVEDGERWRLVVVAGISLDLPSAHPDVLLRESTTPYRELRIPVGLPEGTAIAHAWRGIETPRPLTHELMTDLLAKHGISIEAARITARKGQLFHAELDTMGPRGRQVIPCRPSDAIALVLRQQLPTPLLVAEDVLTGKDETQD